MKFKNPTIWMFFGLFLMFALYQNTNNSLFGTEPKKLSYTQFIDEVHQGKIKSVESDEGNKLIVTKKDKTKYEVNAPRNDLFMVRDLIKNQVEYTQKPEEKPSILLNILLSWGPMLLIFGLIMYSMKQMSGKGGGGIMSFGKSKAKALDESANKVRFSDVAGCDEAKEEVTELVDFLRDPKKFENLGGKIPKGVLLVGSPGTGKTLLAKAIAGEAKVPFFSMAGSDFVEMFVGVGAARVRDLFEQARAAAPCIIFIDEIDAVGRSRGAGIGGGNDEREQTLNQMLVEMDGFESTAGIIIIAATNRPDVLDAALLRPGRFDRQVHVPLPDVKGREQILNVYLKKLPIENNVDVNVLARGTPGFSGAELSNLTNEAALFAARRNAQKISMLDFEKAKDKIIMGAERRSMVMKEDEKKNTAYHEAGHALVARLLKNTDPVHKVTIIPRGRALGVTVQLPEEERYSQSKDYLLNLIAILFGGRIAEEVFMNQMTTGASNDFERATKIARSMVSKFGMTKTLGVMVYHEEDQGYGYSRSSVDHLSQSTLEKVDQEIRKILETQYQITRKLIEDHRYEMHLMAQALLEWETIDAKHIDAIFEGKYPDILKQRVERELSLQNNDDSNNSSKNSNDKNGKDDVWAEVEEQKQINLAKKKSNENGFGQSPKSLPENTTINIKN